MFTEQLPMPSTGLDTEDTVVEKPLLLVIQTQSHNSPTISSPGPLSSVSYILSDISSSLYVCFQSQHISLGLHHLKPKPVFELLSQSSFNLKCTDYNFLNPDFFLGSSILKSFIWLRTSYLKFPNAMSQPPNSGSNSSVQI